MLTVLDFKEKQFIFTFTNEGEYFSFKNDNIILKNKENVTIHQSSCYKLFVLGIIGPCSITSGLMERAKRFGFQISLMSYSLKPYASFGIAAEGNFLLREKQYRYDSLDIAHFLVKNKIASQRNNLSSIRHKTNEIKDEILQLKKMQENVISNRYDLKNLLGVEGASSRIYFSSYYKDFQWKGRKPRVKHDIINCLLDIGYTKLFYIIEAMLSAYGFDLYKGFFHQQFYQRKSLVCDLIEPFRFIIDRSVRNALRLNMVKEEDFLYIKNQYRLFGTKAKPYISWILKDIMKERIQIFKYIQSFYRCFMKNSPIKEYPDIQ